VGGDHLDLRRSAVPPRRSGAGCGRASGTRASGPGLTTKERQRLKQLERENVELRRANEILKKAAAYFAQAELDRRAK
jgi:transposase-like protein